MPGEESFVDHVHPTVEGNRWLAEAIIETLTAKGIVDATESWSETRGKAVEAMSRYSSGNPRRIAQKIEASDGAPLPHGIVAEWRPDGGLARVAEYVLGTKIGEFAREEERPAESRQSPTVVSPQADG